MDLPFARLGRYRILRELGRGAMGIVFLAEDEVLQRQVAIKTLLLPDDGEQSRQQEARFRQEAQAAGGLNHPNTVTIHDFGREGNWLYIAMERLQGVELRDLMQGGALPLDSALDVAGQVASGLAAAHARGVVHRDIKPGNIMVLPGGQAKIMDFGIARMQSSDLRTATGTMMGSPKYMSPEQVAGHPVDHRSDIFSLGSVLYEMVTGQPAFEGQNLGVLLSAIQRAATVPPAVVRPGLPASVELVIVRAMQRNPQARYQAAADMAQDLAQCRGTLARLRGATDAVGATGSPGATSIALDLDLDVATAPGHPAAALEPQGWPLAGGFDSSAGFEHLCATAGTEAPAYPREVDRLGRAAWALAYAAAVAAGLAIAFG